MKKIIADQAWHAERAVIGIAVIDDLDPGHDRTDRIRNGCAVERRFLRRNVTGKLDGDLALDPQPAIILRADCRSLVRHRCCEDLA